MKRTILTLTILGAVCAFAETNSVADVISNVSNALQQVRTQAGERELEGIRYELLNFELGFNDSALYKSFVPIVTNDWRTVVTNINLITTNYVDKILIFGTGKQGDEALYLSYLETLTRMRINNKITERDLSAFDASTRYDLQSVLIRRYREPAISNLVEQLKIAWPSLSNHWNSILSGERYLKYLDEAAARQWGENPPM